MATATPPKTKENDTSGWELVHEEAPDQLKFEEVGEEYVLEYLGSEEIDPGDEKDPDKRFTQLRFRETDGNPVVTNAGYELRVAFKDITPGHLVKIKYVKNVQVGEASPMKSFKVWQGPKTSADNKG